MRGCALKLAVFDAGHMVGVKVSSDREEVKPFAFRISVETAEMLVEDLRDALKQAEQKRENYRLDREAGVYGPYISKIF